MEVLNLLRIQKTSKECCYHPNNKKKNQIIHKIISVGELSLQGRQILWIPTSDKPSEEKQYTLIFTLEDEISP